MSYKYVAKIPFSKIDRIELYVNKSRKTLAQIKLETKADYILNGSLFNMSTFQQYCNVKANGIVQYNPKYNEYGMAWNTNDIKMMLIPDQATSYKNYIGMKPLCYHGVDKPVNDKASDIGGKRGRSAMALTSVELVLYCSKDGSSYAAFPSKLRTELKSMGCADILMLDSGGSSQCDFAGKKITSTREVANLILVYLKKSSTTLPAGSTVTITAAPVAMTPTYGTVSTNVNIRSGPGTNYQNLGIMKKGTRVQFTGKTVSGNWYRYANGWVCASYVYLDSNRPITSACPYAKPAATLRVGSRGDGVKWLQWYLVNKFGYTMAIDGSFGPTTTRIVKDFQAKHQLTADGIVGPTTKNAILN